MKKKPSTHLQLLCNYMEITLQANCSDRCLIASPNGGENSPMGILNYFTLTTFCLSLKQWKYEAIITSFCSAGDTFPPHLNTNRPAPASALSPSSAARRGKPLCLWQRSWVSKCFSSSEASVVKLSQLFKQTGHEEGPHLADHSPQSDCTSTANT